MEFVLGKQWSDSDIAKLNAKSLPYLTKNLILPIINRVYGMELQNRTDMVVTPTEEGFDEVAQGMTRLNYYFSRHGKLSKKLSQMFVLGLINDMGAYIRPVFSTLDDPLGSIDYKVIDGRNILTDPLSKEYDLSDSKRLIYTTWFTKRDAANLYPDKKKEISSLQNYKDSFRDRMTRKIGIVTDKIAERDMYQRAGRYRLIEMWERKEVLDTFWFDPMSNEKFKPKTKREVGELQFVRPNAVQRTERKVEQHLHVTLGDSTVLYSGLAPIQSKQYPFFRFTPYHMNGDTLGMVNNLKDYNREHNKRSSSILHILSATANSGWLYEEGSINAERWEQDSNKNGAMLGYRGNRPEKIQPNQIPSGMVYTDEQAKQGIYETSGVGANMLGRAENSRESGKLFARRVDEGNIMVQPIFENYAYTKQLLGEYQIWLYQNVLSEMRIASIIAEENIPEREAINMQTAVEIAKNKKIGKYNVTVDTVTKRASERQAKQDTLGNLAKAMPPELINWATLIRATDLPTDIKEKLAQYAEQKLGIADGLQEMSGQSQADPQSIQQIIGA